MPPPSYSRRIDSGIDELIERLSTATANYPYVEQTDSTT
jgi:hypothetical protein